MFVKKMLKISAVFVFVTIFYVSSAFAADETVLTVGSVKLSETDVLQMLASTAGGNKMMVGMILGQSTVKERKEVVGQMADAVLFAEAAKSAGLDRRSDIAFQIKWQTMQTLLQAYLQQLSAKWDMSDKAMRTYYDNHKQEFVQAAAAQARHILTETESDALSAALQIYKTKDFAKVAAAAGRERGVVERLDPELDHIESERFQTLQQRGRHGVRARGAARARHKSLGAIRGGERLARHAALLGEGRDAESAFAEAFGETERSLLLRARAHAVAGRSLARFLPSI